MSRVSRKQIASPSRYARGRGQKNIQQKVYVGGHRAPQIGPSLLYSVHSVIFRSLRGRCQRPEPTPLKRAALPGCADRDSQADRI